MRQRISLTIRRDDHLEDPLGAAFLEPGKGNEDAILGRLRAYLGSRLTIVKAEIGAREASVDAEASCFPEEAGRLLDEAAVLWRSGARRGAIDLARQALELHPFNIEANLRLGEWLSETENYQGALQALRRAREFGGDNNDVLRRLAMVSLALKRKASAIAYLKRALEFNPHDFSTLRALAKFGYKHQRSVKSKPNKTPLQGKFPRNDASRSPK